MHNKQQFGVGDSRERVDDGSGVHPQADEETEQQLQVAILGGHTGEQDTEAQSQSRQHHYEQRQQQCIPVGMDGCVGEEHIVGIYAEEQSELYAETHEVADDIAQRGDKTGEIYLTEDTGVVDEGIACLGQTVGEVLPKTDTSQVE